MVPLALFLRIAKQKKECYNTMARKNKSTGRKDSKGRALSAGEYQRASGSYEYKYREEGRQLSISAPTLDELREKEKAIERDRVDGIKTRDARVSLNSYFQKWKLAKRGLKWNTRSNYIYMYNKFVERTMGRKRIADIKYTDIKRFFNDLVNRGVTVNTCGIIQNVLHQIFDMAEKDDAIRRNPTDNALRELRREFPQVKKKALTPEEQRRFLQFIQGTEWYPVFSFMIKTGLRVGELSGLTWDDIDYQNNIIRIRRNLIYYKDAESGKMLRRINTTKTAAGFRELPLADDVKEVLQEQREYGKICTAEVDGVSGFIFGNRYGDTVGQATLNRALKRIIRAANDEDTDVLLPDFSCHSLRHTYATNHARAGTDITTLMGLLGHSDMQTTVEIYTEAQLDMKQNAEKKRQESEGRI